MISMREVLDYGMTLIGIDYRWGGNDPRTGLDCSGLVQAIFRRFGVNLPRVSRDQARVGRAVSARQAQAGDLIAFDNSSSRAGVDHIGIYLGNGMMLVSPRTGQKVQVQRVNLNRAVAIRRPVRANYDGLQQRTNGTYVYTSTPSATRSGHSNAPEGDGGNMTDQEIYERVLRDYGYLAAFLKHAEIGPILTRAVREGRSGEWVQGQISKTRWWKTTHDTMREWDAQAKANPGQAKYQLQQAVYNIQSMGQRMGITVSDPVARKLALNQLRLGWSTEQIQNTIATYFHPTSTKGQGGQFAQQLKDMADEYLIPLSNGVIDRWVTQMLMGRQTPENFRKYLLDQAKSMYPQLAGSLDSGVTVRQFADPFVQHAAKLLDLTPEQVDLRQPKWQKALMKPTEDGKRTTMTLDEWDRELKGNRVYGYQNSRDGSAQGSHLAEFLSRTFGEVA